MQNNNTETTNKHNRKNLIISGALIIVVLAALFGAPRLTNRSLDKMEKEAAEVAEVATTTTSTTALSRAEATTKYADALIRFSGADCVMEPKSMTQPHYRTIMIDNDTDLRRTIMVGEKSYSVGARRYTLSWLNTGAGTLPVTCDGKEVGTIVVQ